MAECKLLCKEVTKGKERNKQKLSYLLEQTQKSSFSQTKIEEIMRTKRAETNVRRSEVFTPSSNRQVLTNPLPSIRRLPTLPLLATAEPGGVRSHQGVCLPREKTVDLGRRTLRMRRFWDMEE